MVEIDSQILFIAGINAFVLVLIYMSGFLAAVGFAYLDYSRQKPALKLVLGLWLVVFMFTPYIPYGAVFVPLAILLAFLARRFLPEHKTG